MSLHVAPTFQPAEAGRNTPPRPRPTCSSQAGADPPRPPPTRTPPLGRPLAAYRRGRGVWSQIRARSRAVPGRAGWGGRGNRGGHKKTTRRTSGLDAESTQAARRPALNAAPDLRVGHDHASIRCSSRHGEAICGAGRRGGREPRPRCGSTGRSWATSGSCTNGWSPCQPSRPGRAGGTGRRDVHPATGYRTPRHTVVQGGCSRKVGDRKAKNRDST